MQASFFWLVLSMAKVDMTDEKRRALSETRIAEFWEELHDTRQAIWA